MIKAVGNQNNVDILDFTVFDGTPHSATLQQQNLVLKEVRDGRIVPYVIRETERIQTTDPLPHMLQELGFKLLSQVL